MPGASIAVTDRGKIVFTPGYGYADVASAEKVKTGSLFRIASIPKPITAVAVLRLVEKDQLDRDDKVLSVLNYENDIAAAGDAFDPRWRDIKRTAHPKTSIIHSAGLTVW